MRDIILESFPDLAEISDDDIREGVITAFEKAMNLGEWQDLDSFPFTLLLKDLEVSFATHTRIVTSMAISAGDILIDQDIPINRNYLIAGALLHDVGKLIEYKRESTGTETSKTGKTLRHPVLGTWLALEARLPPEIAHIIYCHSWEGDKVKRSPEAHIVFRCDFMHFESLKSTM